MTQNTVTYRNGRIFDGVNLFDGHWAKFDDGVQSGIGSGDTVPDEGQVIDLAGDILTPGYVDLQVNGGGGIMFNDDPSVKTLERIANAHIRLGVSTFLPTLITDTEEVTRSAIEAAISAISVGVPGVTGLHLEGPHLSVARKGAHDASLIRPMSEDDLDALLKAATALPVLKVTVAPESVTVEQVAILSRAGVLVSLGHSDASFDCCQRYINAGARCVTHLFNAMSQLGNREPGLVGAALASGDVSCGLIADAVHVHPQTIRAAFAAKSNPGRIFLVSDSMAVAGTDESEFKLGGRLIQRKNKTLTLRDGTLAGADLELTRAIKVLVEQVHIPLEAALQSAISIPAALIGNPFGGAHPKPLRLKDMRRISKDLSKVESADPRC